MTKCDGTNHAWSPSYSKLSNRTTYVCLGCGKVKPTEDELRAPCYFVECGDRDRAELLENRSNDGVNIQRIR